MEKVIITNKKNEMVQVGDSLSYWSNGYPVVDGMAYVKEDVNVFEISSDIPTGVETGKYCYTEEQGFYPNPDWVEPDPANIYGIPDELYYKIVDDVVFEIYGGEE